MHSDDTDTEPWGGEIKCLPGLDGTGDRDNQVGLGWCVARSLGSCEALQGSGTRDGVEG